MDWRFLFIPSTADNRLNIKNYKIADCAVCHFWLHGLTYAWPEISGNFSNPWRERGREGRKIIFILNWSQPITGTIKDYQTVNKENPFQWVWRIVYWHKKDFSQILWQKQCYDIFWRLKEFDSILEIDKRWLKSSEPLWTADEGQVEITENSLKV